MVAYIICLSISVGLSSLLLFIQNKRIDALENKVKELEKKND